MVSPADRRSAFQRLAAVNSWVDSLLRSNGGRRGMLANPDIGVTQIAYRLGVSPATLYR